MINSQTHLVIHVYGAISILMTGQAGPTLWTARQGGCLGLEGGGAPGLGMGIVMCTLLLPSHSRGEAILTSGEENTGQRECNCKGPEA